MRGICQQRVDVCSRYIIERERATGQHLGHLRDMLHATDGLMGVDVEKALGFAEEATEIEAAMRARARRGENAGDPSQGLS